MAVAPFEFFIILRNLAISGLLKSSVL